MSALLPIAVVLLVLRLIAPRLGKVKRIGWIFRPIAKIGWGWIAATAGLVIVAFLLYAAMM